jgi:hypothetical protein
MFESLVPHIKERLTKHHELYSGQCKSEYWEENLAYALRAAGFGSDWKPDFNHKSGVDQTTDDSTGVSNKTGKIIRDTIEISGSRLTKHKTLKDKLDFLAIKKEDYIFCLATEKEDWESEKKIYYFIVIDSNILNYHEQDWTEVIGQRGATKDKVSGWQCVSEDYSAKIQKSMSDQLWTTVKLDACEEIHDIVIG